MKESDGAEQPTTGHLRRARLGRITLWKSYALIHQEKTMIRGATGWKNDQRYIHVYTYIRIYTYLLVYLSILHGSMKKKKVSEGEDVVLMANAELCFSKSSPISKHIINNILVKEFVLPNLIFLSRLSLRPHVAQPLSASKLTSSRDVVLNTLALAGEN